MRMRNMIADAILPSVSTSSFALGVGTTLLALRYMPEMDMDEMSADIRKRARTMKQKMANMDLDDVATNDQNFRSTDDSAIVDSSLDVEELETRIRNLQVQLNQLKNNVQ